MQEIKENSLLPENQTINSNQQSQQQSHQQSQQSQQSYGLFNNPMITQLRSQMTDSQIKSLQLWGEYMYSTTNFDDVSRTEVPPFLQSRATEIDELIKNGCHISLLSIDEKQLMVEVKGEKWYEEYGYIAEDLDSIVTFK
jgi:hypothetical protein